MPTQGPQKHFLESYIMFTSGTTGLPKCMVQGAGGILINQMKNHRRSTCFKQGCAKQSQALDFYANISELNED